MSEMTLNVPFKCTITTHQHRKNFSGEITLLPKDLKPRTFYFLLLNPYDGASAEFSLYEDLDRKIPFAEGIGLAEQGTNPHTGLPITYYDFSIDRHDSKFGLTFILSLIISEGIYQAEIAGKVPVAEFKHYWQNNFTEKTVDIAESFLKSFDPK